MVLESIESRVILILGFGLIAALGRLDSHYRCLLTGILRPCLTRPGVFFFSAVLPCKIVGWTSGDYGLSCIA